MRFVFFNNVWMDLVVNMSLINIVIMSVVGNEVVNVCNYCW